MKIAILGIENSHSRCFAPVLAPKEGKKIFEDVELIGVYGDPNEDGYTEGVADLEKKALVLPFLMTIIVFWMKLMPLWLQQDTEQIISNTQRAT